MRTAPGCVNDCDLEAVVSGWRASRTDLGDVAAFTALRFTLESSPMDADRALELIALARRSIDRMPKSGRDTHDCIRGPHSTSIMRAS